MIPLFSTWAMTCMQMMQTYIMQETLCFFLDEKKGYEISFVQFPQNYDNITKNDIYACSISVVNNVSNL